MSAALNAKADFCVLTLKFIGWGGIRSPHRRWAAPVNGRSLVGCRIALARVRPVLRTAYLLNLKSVQLSCRKTNVLSFGLPVAVGRLGGSVDGGLKLESGWPAMAKPRYIVANAVVGGLSERWHVLNRLPGAR